MYLSREVWAPFVAAADRAGLSVAQAFERAIDDLEPIGDRELLEPGACRSWSTPFPLPRNGSRGCTVRPSDAGIGEQAAMIAAIHQSMRRQSIGMSRLWNTRTSSAGSAYPSTSICRPSALRMVQGHGLCSRAEPERRGAYAVDQPLTLVLVEGHEQIRFALATRMARLPHVRLLAAVGDVESAVPVIAALRPDVVLFEPKTMRRHAVTALQALRATECPVVIWTASLVDGEADMLRSNGATAVLLKEASVADLVQGLQDALRSPS